MSTYIIGDVHGCFDEMMALLKQIAYRPGQDELYFTGDLVNRGSQSLEVLRWVLKRRDHVHAVLGNHDLHLIGRALGVYAKRPGDTLDAILHAPDCGYLIDQLRTFPLLIEQSRFVLVHAGFSPTWTHAVAATQASRLHRVLSHSVTQATALLQDVYSRESQSSLSEATFERDALAGALRVMTNIRFCDVEGRAVYRASYAPKDAPSGLFPWYRLLRHRDPGRKIIFGHWAQLGFLATNHVVGIDTGCVWGGSLTAYQVEDAVRFCVSGRPN